jgi:hypothetical protein
MDKVALSIKQLEDTDAGNRKRAAMNLGDLKDARTFEPLIIALDDTDWEVRKAAALALGYKSEIAVYKSLVGMKDDENPQVRHAAADSLRRWQEFFHKVKYIYFGVISREEEKYGTTLKDPDLSGLAVPMPNLWKVYINTRSFDPALVGKFIDYALKHLDQEDVRKHVNIYYFGSLRNLSPDLHRHLKDLFAREWQLL